MLSCKNAKLVQSDSKINIDITLKIKVFKAIVIFKAQPKNVIIKSISSTFCTALWVFQTIAFHSGYRYTRFAVI